jgi:transcriptional repressor NF-X1
MSETNQNEHKSAAESTAAIVQSKNAKPNRRRRPRSKPQGADVNAEAAKAMKPDQSSSAVDDPSSSAAQAKKPSRRRRRGGNKKPGDDVKMDGDDHEIKDREVAQQPIVDRPAPKPKSRFNKNRAQAQLTDASTEVPVLASLPSSSAAPVATPKKRNNTRRSRNQNSRISQLKEDEIKDLLTSLTHGLTTSSYDCMICWDIVRPGQQTWSCDCCWAVFHLGCVQTWATKSLHGKENDIR